MWQGYGHFKTLLKGMEEYLEREKLESLDAIRGKTLPYITTIEEASQRPALVSQVAPERCTNLKKGGCEVCGKVCFYGAIEFSPRLRLKPEHCDGCNLCVEICPVGALRLAPPER
jgi:ferredoxin